MLKKKIKMIYQLVIYKYTYISCIDKKWVFFSSVTSVFPYFHSMLMFLLKSRKMASRYGLVEEADLGRRSNAIKAAE